MAYYLLHVSIPGIQPPVWRELIVPGELPLDRVHDVLAIAFEWSDAHLHEFQDGKQRYGLVTNEDPELRDEAEVTLDAVVKPGGSLTYVYDFGDDWQHEIRVIEVMRTLPDDVPVPLWCRDGERSAPLEDSGGPQGYETFLAMLADPNHPERSRWQAEYEVDEFDESVFDPEWFDPDLINLLLVRYIRYTMKPAFNWTPFLV